MSVVENIISDFNSPSYQVRSVAYDRFFSMREEIDLKTLASVIGLPECPVKADDFFTLCSKILAESEIELSSFTISLLCELGVSDSISISINSEKMLKEYLADEIITRTIKLISLKKATLSLSGKGRSFFTRFIGENNLIEFLPFVIENLHRCDSELVVLSLGVLKSFHEHRGIVIARANLKKGIPDVSELSEYISYISAFLLFKDFSLLASFRNHDSSKIRTKVLVSLSRYQGAFFRRRFLKWFREEKSHSVKLSIIEGLKNDSLSMRFMSELYSSFSGFEMQSSFFNLLLNLDVNDIISYYLKKHKKINPQLETLVLLAVSSNICDVKIPAFQTLLVQKKNPYLKSLLLEILMVSKLASHELLLDCLKSDDRVFKYFSWTILSHHRGFDKENVNKLSDHLIEIKDRSNFEDICLLNFVEQNLEFIEDDKLTSIFKIVGNDKNIALKIIDLFYQNPKRLYLKSITTIFEQAEEFGIGKTANRVLARFFTLFPEVIKNHSQMVKSVPFYSELVLLDLPLRLCLEIIDLNLASLPDDLSSKIYSCLAKSRSVGHIENGFCLVNKFRQSLKGDSISPEGIVAWVENSNWHELSDLDSLSARQLMTDCFGKEQLGFVLNFIADQGETHIYWYPYLQRCL
ncbi:MAG: hypothetical protein HOE90_10690 [Bacteriovoracaceae bacterium]|jgi:hypothetical protein|nr:hypothetical protein [Bacteriovoracaceae bacterium]